MDVNATITTTTMTRRIPDDCDLGEESECQDYVLVKEEEEEEDEPTIMYLK